MDEQLRAKVRQFVLFDLRQRVGRIVVGLRASRLNVKWHLEIPPTGLVTSREFLPDVSPPFGGRYVPWWYQWNDGIHWFDLPLNEGAVWSGYGMPFCTYSHTVALDHSVWCEYRRDPKGPRVPVGYTLEPFGNQLSLYNELNEKGVFVSMSYYQKLDDNPSVQRQLAGAFIREIEVPGYGAVNCDIIDAQLNLLHALTADNRTSEGSQVVGLNERNRFIDLLKAECGVIKQDRGPFAAKAAYDLMKYATRVLDGDQLKLKSGSI